jgi:hypothetical protein
MKTVGVAVAGLSDLGPIVPVLKALGRGCDSSLSGST